MPPSESSNGVALRPRQKQAQPSGLRDAGAEREPQDSLDECVRRFGIDVPSELGELGSVMSRVFRLARITLVVVSACTASSEHDGSIGAAGESSGGGAEVADCEPEVLYQSDGALPTWVAAAGDYVFWIEQGSDSLLRQRKAGGEPELVSSNIAAWWGGIAADGDAVFVGTRDAVIRRFLVDGSPGVVLAEIGGERASRLQVQGDYLYWLAAGGRDNGRRVVADVRRVRKDGSGASELLWSGDRSTYGLAVGAGGVFVEEYTLPVASGDTPQPNGTIFRRSSAGEVTTIATGLLIPQVQATDDRFVYYSAQTEDAEREAQLWRLSIDGGPAELVHAGGAGFHMDVGQMIVEGGFVWWGQANDGLLVRVSDAGGQPDLVAVTDSAHTLGLASDGERLYFSGGFSPDAVGPGTIFQVGRGCPID